MNLRVKLASVKNLTAILLLVVPVVFAQSQTPLNFTEPYLLTLAPAAEMNVCWISSEPASAWVEYGPTPAYGSRVDAVEHVLRGLKRSPAADRDYLADPDANPDLQAWQHIAHIRGLKPDTLYYYRTVTAGATRSSTSTGYYFRTAPAGGRKIKFTLLSDLQLKPQIPSTVKLVGEQQPDFIIYNGDFVNTSWKAGEWFPVPGVHIDPKEAGHEFFTVMQQRTDDCRLLQYVPIFPTPGNHEVADQRLMNDPAMAVQKDRWSLSIYMQLFRPLYPEQQAGPGGKHWYSADYGDMHIVSLSVFRWHPWEGLKFPGWHLFDDVRGNSPQVRWLAADLAATKARHKWVTMHWHMFNRGDDGHVPYSEPQPDPANPGAVTYPEPDYCHNVLKPLFERYGVDGVSFGHSHVYERYAVNGVNYIEAASIGNSYRKESDPYHPSGQKPVVEENRFRSFMILTFGADETLSATGIQASVEPGGGGHVGRVFDRFRLK
jgi:hypothetical protein